MQPNITSKQWIDGLTWKQFGIGRFFCMTADVYKKEKYGSRIQTLYTIMHGFVWCQMNMYSLKVWVFCCIGSLVQKNSMNMMSSVWLFWSPFIVCSDTYLEEHKLGEILFGQGRSVESWYMFKEIYATMSWCWLIWACHLTMVGYPCTMGIRQIMGNWPCITEKSVNLSHW